MNLKENRFYEYVPIKKHNNKKIAYFMLIIFLGILIFFGYKTVNYIMESKKTLNNIKEISKLIVTGNLNDKQVNKDNTTMMDTSFNIDFNGLKKKNPDVVSFLKVNGTDIEYVVVKSIDNVFYLYHGFDKERNSAGWIFADYNNKLDGTDKNIIIYGHDMKNGTMFASLKNILSKDWYSNKENRYIRFITEWEDSIYEVFSVYQIKSQGYYRKMEFKEGEFQEYIDTVKSRSIYNFNVNVSSFDSILTLSTCATNNKYIVVLHAKKIV